MNTLLNIGWFGSDALLGIAINANEENYRILVIRKRKNELHVKEEQIIENTDALLVYLSKTPGIPLVVWINSDGVVEKEIGIEESDALSAALGVRVENRKAFVYQDIFEENNSRKISVIRRDQLEEILSPLKDFRKRIVYIFPGEKGLVNLEEQNLDITESSRPLLSAMLYFFMTKGNDIHGWSEGRENLHSLNQDFKLMRMTGISAILLLIFFIVGLSGRSYFNREISNTREFLAENKLVLDKIQSNTDRISLEKNFIRQSAQGHLKPTRVSYLIDKIGSQAPEGLVFDLLIYHPEAGFLKKISYELEENPPHFWLEGQSSSAQAISDFSLKLQQIPSFLRTEIRETNYDFRLESHRFSIAIYLENE